MSIRGIFHWLVFRVGVGRGPEWECRGVQKSAEVVKSTSCSLKNVVFFEGRGRAGMLGLQFVPGVRNARAIFLSLAAGLLGLGSIACVNTEAFRCWRLVVGDGFEHLGAYL